MKNQKGFTLVELIIVIAIIAIIAVAAFVAIDPARRFNEARNSTRWTDVTAIIDAVKKYQADNDGSHLAAINDLTAGEYHQIGTEPGNNCAGTCTAQAVEATCVDLSGIGSNYLATIPKDPSSGTDAETDYYLMKDANGAINVGACDPEGEGAGGNGAAPAILLTR